MPLFLRALSGLDKLLLVELSLRTLKVGVLEEPTLAGAGEIEDDLVESAYWFVTVSSFARQTGTRLVLISTAVCNIGFDICKLRKLLLSGLGGPSTLLRDEVGDRLLFSSLFFSDLSILCLSLVGVLLT